MRHQFQTNLFPSKRMRIRSNKCAAKKWPVQTICALIPLFRANTPPSLALLHSSFLLFTYQYSLTIFSTLTLSIARTTGEQKAKSKFVMIIAISTSSVTNPFPAHKPKPFTWVLANSHSNSFSAITEETEFFSEKPFSSKETFSSKKKSSNFSSPASIAVRTVVDSVTVVASTDRLMVELVIIVVDVIVEVVIVVATIESLTPDEADVLNPCTRINYKNKIKIIKTPFEKIILLIIK